ncbi:hypothetical protein [Streptomyces sp. NPDC127108]|uniref:hypothetical protein n=1 Tax=Streptomyces sp. NPDC127108 TaxID=3345361 RepID=UPI00363C6EAA
MQHDRRKPEQVDGAVAGRLAHPTRACAAYTRHGALLAPTKRVPTGPAPVPPLAAGTIHLTAPTELLKDTHHGVPSPDRADLLVSSVRPLPTTPRRSPTP